MHPNEINKRAAIYDGKSFCSEGDWVTIDVKDFAYCNARGIPIGLTLAERDFLFKHGTIWRIQKITKKYVWINDAEISHSMLFRTLTPIEIAQYRMKIRK